MDKPQFLGHLVEVHKTSKLFGSLLVVPLAML